MSALHLYVVSAIVRKDAAVMAVPGVQVASSEDEALGKILKAIMTDNPGYEVCAIKAHLISDSFVMNAAADISGGTARE